MYNFTRNVGWSLIFDLNLMLRTDNSSTGKWNSTNAQQFINYSSQKGYTMDFELGNGIFISNSFFQNFLEPEFLQSLFGYSLTGAQIADSYHDLRNLLNSNSLFKNSKIIGPSILSRSTGLTSTEEQIFEEYNIKVKAQVYFYKFEFSQQWWRQLY